jgi:hypothetical protein
MTALQDHSATTQHFPENAPASVWVLFRGQLQYRLADGHLAHPYANDLEPVTSLVHVSGTRERMVCGPADSLAAFCEGQVLTTMPLSRILTGTATLPVHFA